MSLKCGMHGTERFVSWSTCPGLSPYQGIVLRSWAYSHSASLDHQGIVAALNQLGWKSFTGSLLYIWVESSTLGVMRFCQ